MCNIESVLQFKLKELKELKCQLKLKHFKGLKMSVEVLKAFEVSVSCSLSVCL